MKLAIMQPYFFPYIGYFELMASVDVFVFLNDVQYIRRGWVNRNRIPSRHKQFQYLTVPVATHARSASIKQIQIIPDWVDHHIAILHHSYGKKIKDHPLFDYYKTLGRFSSLDDMLCDSLIWTARHLGISCEFRHSDGISKETGKDRIVEICRYFKADEYFNLSGGKTLYSSEDFFPMKLQFMPPTEFENRFSILDPIFSDEGKVKEWLAIRQS